MAETQALNSSRQSTTSGGWRKIGECNILWGKWQCCFEDSRGWKHVFINRAGTKVGGYTHIYVYIYIHRYGCMINQVWAHEHMLFSDSDPISVKHLCHSHSSVILISKMDGSTKYEFAGSMRILFLTQIYHFDLD